MSRPKRDDRTKDTIEVVNRAGNRARVDPGSAAETYFKARGYKPIEEEDKEADDGKAALLRPRGAGAHVAVETERPPAPTGIRPAVEPETKADQKGKGGKE